MARLLELVAALLALFHVLGPWGSLALLAAIAVVCVGLYANGDRLLEWFIHRQARAVGKVMKDAAVTIHSITPAEKPDPSVWRTGDDEEDDEFEAQLEASGMPEGDYDWFRIDATIEPRSDATGGPVAWEPTMVHLTKDDGASRHALEVDTDCLIAQVERWADGAFVAFEQGTLDGPARIRLYVGVVPGTQDVRFSYLGELFGRLRLPSRRRSYAH
jgi:hypothetical protein